MPTRSISAGRVARPAAVAALGAILTLVGCDPTLPWADASGGGDTGGPAPRATFAAFPAFLTFSEIAGHYPPEPKLIFLDGLVDGSVVDVATTGTVTLATSTTGGVWVRVGNPTTAGTFTGSVTITGYSDATRTVQLPGSPITVPVTYTVRLASSPTTLAFSASTGDCLAPSKRVVLTGLADGYVLDAAGAGIVSGATPTLDSSTTGHVTVSVPPPSTVGNFSGSVTITGYTDATRADPLPGTPITVPVTYTVATPSVSSLQASASCLVFEGFEGGSDPSPQTFTLSRVDGTSSPWTLLYSTDDSPLSAWLTLSPTSGSTLPTTIQVTAHVGSLTAGTTRTAMFHIGPNVSGLDHVHVQVAFTISP